MVIGNGMIAHRFIDYATKEDFIIFASGVSNSKDTVKEHYDRELQLLTETIAAYPDKVLIYFSTCSVKDPDLQSTPYVNHKLHIEKYISEKADRYYIFRISNLAGVSNNPYTLLNYFIFTILKDQPLTVWKNAYRNIIGIDDMYALVSYFLKEKKNINTAINIANTENYSVPYIIDCIEEHLHKKAIGKEIEKGTSYEIDTSLIQTVIHELNIQFNDAYLPVLLKKYYHSR
jgi:nucleoside-diphosphate-sugar epimerase